MKLDIYSDRHCLCSGIRQLSTQSEQANNPNDNVSNNSNTERDEKYQSKGNSDFSVCRCLHIL